jgi:DNA-binding HxlR family transcriptional regulator
MKSGELIQLPCGGVSCVEEATAAIETIRNRWSVAILEQLCFASSAVRFGELQRRVAGISQRELSRQLDLLAARGIVTRTVRTSKPLSVDYELTAAGHSLLKHVEALSEWARNRELTGLSD